MKLVGAGTERNTSYTESHISEAVEHFKKLQEIIYWIPSINIKDFWNFRSRYFTENIPKKKIMKSQKLKQNYFTGYFLTNSAQIYGHKGGWSAKQEIN